jgi:zinc and cadmium transporter
VDQAIKYFTLALFFAPLLGAMIAVSFSNLKSKLNVLVIFSGAFLLCQVILHLLPETFSFSSSAGLWILSGFFAQFLIEQLTRGIEHSHEHELIISRSALPSLLIGLSLHGITDGIPLSLQQSLSFWLSMLLHKAAEGFTLMTLLSILIATKVFRWSLLILFSASAPVIVIFFYHSHFVQSAFFSALLGIATGSLLHVTTSILFENENHSHHFSFQKWIAMAAAILLSLLSNF